MNQTTRAIRFHKTGGPEVMRIEEVQRPKPTGNEVLVRVQTLGLSRPVLVWREGSSFEEPVFPAQIGYDAAGVVESIGPEVKKLRVGDRVATFPAVSLLDYTAHGEVIVYPETALHVTLTSLARKNHTKSEATSSLRARELLNRGCASV